VHLGQWHEATEQRKLEGKKKIRLRTQSGRKGRETQQRKRERERKKEGHSH